MGKVAIIGNAGGGKSVLARALGTALNLPVHVIDDAQFEPGWRSAPLEEVAHFHDQWLAGSRWVIDGWGSWELIEPRFQEADTIVLVDFPLRIHYRWALERQLLALLGLSRGWPPKGCSAWGVTRRLLGVIRRVDCELRPRLLALVQEHEDSTRVVRLRSPRELRAFRKHAIELYGV